MAPYPPRRAAVGRRLLPALCRLLGDASGDARASALALLRALLPPLVHFETSAAAALPKAAADGEVELANMVRQLGS